MGVKVLIHSCNVNIDDLEENLSSVPGLEVLEPRRTRTQSHFGPEWVHLILEGLELLRDAEPTFRYILQVASGWSENRGRGVTIKCDDRVIEEITPTRSEKK